MSHDINNGVEAEFDHHGDVDVTQLELDPELPGSDQVASADVAEYALRLGDDSLILSQQLGWWISRAPEIEEDLALGNIALDLLGHARALLHYSGTATGKSEDDLAYWRDEPEFRCCWLVQQPNGNFADTIARQLYYSAYQIELYASLAETSDPGLAAIATKSVREVAYHLDHAQQWVLRLAGGTDKSRAKIVRALDDAWPYVGELFEDDELTTRLSGVVPQPSSLRTAFDTTLTELFAEAELETPTSTAIWAQGREGKHSTQMGYILSELQWLARRHPGATW